MMELKDVILGFLEHRELTGYELKGFFSEFDFLPWSGNNNQIYTALLELEKEGLVSKQTIQQEKLPAQKRYSATDAGKAKLKEALMKPTDAPAVRSDFLLKLAWAECLSAGELNRVIGDYQLTVETELGMFREKLCRGQSDRRSAREEYMWAMLLKNREMAMQAELNWLTQLRNGLANK